MATANCPSCTQALEVEDAYRDWTVRCPHCAHEFVPSEVERAARAAQAADDRPRRRPRDDEYEDDRDRADRRDRDRDRDRDDRDDEPGGVPASVREEALQVVAAPSVWLEICGWLTALGSVGLFILGVVLALEAANNPPQNGKKNPNEELGEVFMVLGCCTGVLGVPYGICMVIGARHMRNLSSHGWALAAGILGVAAFSLSPYCGFIHAGFGAWALITLDKPVVREAFGLPVRRRHRRRRRDWDD